MLSIEWKWTTCEPKKKISRELETMKEPWGNSGTGKWNLRNKKRTSMISFTEDWPRTEPWSRVQEKRQREKKARKWGKFSLRNHDIWVFHMLCRFWVWLRETCPHWEYGDSWRSLNTNCFIENKIRQQSSLCVPFLIEALNIPLLEDFTKIIKVAAVI